MLSRTVTQMSRSCGCSRQVGVPPRQRTASLRPRRRRGHSGRCGARLRATTSCWAANPPIWARAEPPGSAIPRPRCLPRPNEVAVPSWRAEWTIPSRRADQGRDCGAAKIQRIAQNAPRWPDMKYVKSREAWAVEPFACAILVWLDSDQCSSRTTNPSSWSSHCRLMFQPPELCHRGRY
jgi:hypothetical protein